MPPKKKKKKRKEKKKGGSSMDMIKNLITELGLLKSLF
jgi:hypothetical protein